jgi:hypothetical protein
MKLATSVFFHMRISRNRSRFLGDIASQFARFASSFFRCFSASAMARARCSGRQAQHVNSTPTARQQQ